MSKHRILLIEDDTLEAALAMRTVRQIDPQIEVTRLRDGAHFLEYLRENNPLQDVGVAIMDLNMPRIDGHGVLRALRERKERPPFPIVLFSSSEDPEDVERTYELGGSAFVNKPVAPAAYRAAMEHILNFWLTTNRRK